MNPKIGVKAARPWDPFVVLIQLEGLPVAPIAGSYRLVVSMLSPAYWGMTKVTSQRMMAGCCAVTAETRRDFGGSQSAMVHLRD